MLVSDPLAWAPALATASGITGLTFPGMFDEPGCRASGPITPKPASGPEFIQRKSLAIFIKLAASVFSCPDVLTATSWLPMAAKKLSQEANSRPEIGRAHV